MSDLSTGVQEFCCHCKDLTLHDFKRVLGATLLICRSCGRQTDIMFDEDESEGQ